MGMQQHDPEQRQDARPERRSEESRRELIERLMAEAVDEPTWNKVSQARAGYFIALSFRLPN